MPSQVLTSTENNFTKGLVTEFTGLNFPENAATDADNCTFTLIGDVTRRLGINTEVNGAVNLVDRTNKAISTYKWNNVGGDGLTQVVVEQVGSTLYFYRSSSATTSTPLSTTLLASVINLSSFVALNGSFDVSLECQFTDGNGYLFVFHPSCDPIYCTYTSGIITGNTITINTRDFQGVVDGLGIAVRPATLSNQHLYNLENQGWTLGSNWTATSSSVASFSIGGQSFTIASGLSINVGDVAYFSSPYDPPYSGFGTGIMAGTITSYTGTTLTANITGIGGGVIGGAYASNWTIVPINPGPVSSWHTAVGTYPSNSDVWWYYKDNTGVFAPASTINNVTLNSGRAPQGHFILSEFNQSRGTASGLGTLTNISTTTRPRTGTWFQGRVWYAGVDAITPASGTAATYTWTENIYFSQIVSNSNTNFGDCYQTNDPTSETLFDLLPTDGGVMTIQGCGSIYKLFPIQNGMLVFAANGIWFITGSQGIGFSANDYTITKISSVQSISSTSYVNVNGLPYFWNEEGIYAVEPSKNGGLEVNPLTVGTILSFYSEIPTSSKKYVHGDYHPIDYTIQWVYRDTEASNVTGRYTYNKILNFNTYNKSFFPHTIDTSINSINGIIYVTGPGGTQAPNPAFKYIRSNATTISFAEEYDTTYKDWGTVDYTSYFVTGYKLHGDAQRRFQMNYLYTFSRGDEPTSFKLQGLWDFATTGNSGRWSTAQIVNNWSPNFGMIFRRHKIRGQGLVLQLKFTSVSGQPFDIMGWSANEQQNAGV